ncbi:hypothetical protein CAPTEDRAFT_222501 [Capitella teleta]|uniref:Large ribosomal subunit protein mL45 n=1 Tax=Capitella teleta TaxID=283909 RepID=R7T947_CAPTE|nr:hypothetical protein CAPTEDRAFT_222501 [Capitella teleta]|eukprot:ELT87519.1 hypothetical protein CAPTEDRAFT_222501 [Capitella teleta]
MPAATHDIGWVDQADRAESKPLLTQPQLGVLWSVQQRNGTNKHYDPKWRKLRAAKVIKIDLPNYQRMRREAAMSPEEQRSKMKKDGQAPPRSFTEREIILACTGAIMEPYEPPKGDSVLSSLSGLNIKGLSDKGKSMNAVRKIKQYEDDFSVSEFPSLAQEIYLEAHALLEDVEKNKDRLHDLVTEKAYPDMVWKLKNKTFRWKFVESLEPAKVVRVRAGNAISKENMFGQVTVRFHTQQTLALYDRFGRLMVGSEHLVKDCLEYVVFEKHLSEEYSEWRLHAKIFPDWMEPKNMPLKTMKKPDFSGEEYQEVEEDEADDKAVAQTA